MDKDWLQDALPGAMDRAMSGVEGDPWLARRIMDAQKGEQPYMKKKLSVSIALALVLTLLTLSMAAALMQSGIVKNLYGGAEDTPPAVMEQLHTPGASASTAYGILTLDEWLWDGAGLHTAYSVENPTDKPLLYTLEGVWLNGQPLLAYRSNMEGAGTDGRILGGEVNGTALPRSVSLYQESRDVQLFDETGRYQGMAALPQGEAQLRISVAVWEPINPVEAVDYSAYEGAEVTEAKDHLTVDTQGRSELWLFCPEEYSLTYNAAQSGAQTWADAYRTLGWAEMKEVITVETAVNLTQDFPHAELGATEYSHEKFALSVTRFELSQAGGVMEGVLTGDEAALRAMLKNGLCLVDREGERVISGASWWEQEAGGVAFTLEVLPLTGDLPGRVTLAPVLRLEERWDASLPCYDPGLAKPADAIGVYEPDFAHAVDIALVIR